MSEELKGKIQIKPKGAPKPSFGKPVSGSSSRDMEEVKQELKKLKKQVGRLLNIAEHEENIVEENRGKEMTLRLSDGTHETGVLKEITKFQVVLEKDGLDIHYYKSSVISYHF